MLSKLLSISRHYYSSAAVVDLCLTYVHRRKEQLTMIKKTLLIY